MAERDQKVPTPREQSPEKPLVLIPVTAEDVERRKRKIVLSCIAAFVVLAGAAWFTYKRINDPVEARQAYDSGLRLMRATRYEQAVLNFDRAIEIRPELADPYLMRGRTYILQSRPEQAVADFTRVARLRPSDAGVLVERGFAYLNLKDPAQARADAERALALNSKLAQAYNLRAAAERASGDPKRAVEDYSRAIELEATLEFYFQRASTYQVLGDHQRALADFDKAVEFSPDQPHLYFARAQSKAALGDAEGSKKDIVTGRKIDGW